MSVVETPLGKISITGKAEYYGSGKIKSVIADEETEVVLKVNGEEKRGILNYSFDHPRKIYRASVSFFENGNIKSVYFEEPIEVGTSVGGIEAEFITFYEDGSVKGIYPRYGQVNAYWSERDEFNISNYMRINLENVGLILKPMILGFYNSGELRYISVWKDTPVTIPTKYGQIKTEFGFELYKGGQLKSIEPVIGTKIEIAGEEKNAFRLFGNAFHATDNYLRFDENGTGDGSSFQIE